MLLALMWHYAGNGKGEKDMVILPYKDRLVLFSKYLQQLVMESLGKERDLDGQGRAPGHRGLRQQRLDRPARLRAAAPRGRAEFLRDLHRGAEGPRRRRRWKWSRASRAAITCRASCAAPARRFTKTGATRMTLSVPRGRCVRRRRADRAVRTRGRLLRQPGEHQRLPPAGRGGGQEGGGPRPGPAKRGARPPSAPTPGRPGRSPRRRRPTPEDVYHVLNHLAANASKIEKSAASTPGGETFRLCKCV